MRRIIRQKVRVITARLNGEKDMVLLAGFATFFFGFGAGALLNLYLLFIGSPLVLELRSSLSYKSAILGDGIVLPIVNMVVASFLLKYRQLVTSKTFSSALFFGALVTVYFHVNQAVNGLVNWAMPVPWHWNALGVWHAGYMFAVSSLLSLFYLVLFTVMKKSRYEGTKEALVVTLGLFLFFLLLRFDYITLDFSSIMLR